MPMMIQKSTDDVNYFKLKKLTMSDLEENLRTFLKYHVNVMEYEPKKMSEMSVSELFLAINPFKAPVPKNVCNDDIGCLAGLLVRKYYDDLMSYSRDFASGYGYDFEDYQIVGILLTTLMSFKIMERFVCRLFKYLFLVY